MKKLLTQEFLNNYPDMPEEMNELGSFVFYRTYSRWLPNQNRRETWKEAVTRAVEYSLNISIEQFEKNKYEVPIDKIQAEAEVLFDNIFHLRQFLSGRTHWVGGAESAVAEKFPLSNFNCAFIDVTSWQDLTDMFYLLLVGTGVGFRCTEENARNLAPVRLDYELTHSEYKPVSKSERLEETTVNIMGNGYAKIYVGDSKEGWVQALSAFFKLLTNEEYKNVKHIKISYNSIRPRGERLKTFGGIASGHESLRDMFIGIDKVLKGEFAHVDKEVNGVHAVVRPIHVLDIGNLIGNNVVVGGVRRTAEIFLCDSDDEEVINAKRNITPNLTHRYMSNNSIVFESKPTREELHKVFESIKENGEPGLVNMESAKKRRPNAKGINPCGEILLDSYGVCNLTTVNVMAFVKPLMWHDEEGNTDSKIVGYKLDYQGLMQAQALSARAGLRMTCLDLELPEWDEVHKRDRIIGCSLTGWKDAMDTLGYNLEQETNLLAFLYDVANEESTRYSHILRIPTPLLNTTIKPEGTLSQVAGGVSSGIHVSHAPYFIRRIRISANDPLAKVAVKLNWKVQPEVGQTLSDATTLVIDFPQKSSVSKTRAEQTIEEQFETYFSFQENYTSHNSSNTITVKDDEWDKAEEIVWDNWDKFIGVTFLPYDGGTYELAPYEECTEKEYNALKERMKPFDISLLTSIEKEETEKDLTGLQNCESGVCPII